MHSPVEQAPGRNDPDGSGFLLSARIGAGRGLGEAGCCGAGDRGRLRARGRCGLYRGRGANLGGSDRRSR